MKNRGDKLARILRRELSAVEARIALQTAELMLKKMGTSMATASAQQILRAVEDSIGVLVAQAHTRSRLLEQLRIEVGAAPPPGARPGPPAATHRDSRSDRSPIEVPILGDAGIMEARRQCRSMCKSIGFGSLDCVRITTVVSELARNIAQYAGSGEVQLIPVSRPRTGISIRAIDNGPGIRNLQDILAGTFKSRTGFGRGIVGSKAVMHDFDIETSAEGTVVQAARYLPT